MTDAYVMLNCELGAEAEIIEKLKELEQVKDVFETIGTHDMMVKLQADNFEKNKRDCFSEYSAITQSTFYFNSHKKG